MLATFPLLAHLVAFISQFKYALVFLGVIIEGPFLMIASGFLLHGEYFNFWPLFVALVAGDLLADIGWYYIGYYFLDPILKNYGHFLSITPEALEKAKVLFHRYHTKILFISKVTIGLGLALATLMVAGASHVSIRKYILLNLIGEIVLVSVLLTLGYFFGNMYESVATNFRAMFLIGGIACFIAIIFGFSYTMKNKFLKS